MWYLRDTITGHAVSCNYARREGAEAALGHSELLTVTRNHGAEWFRWWRKRQTMGGVLPVDIDHRCPLPGVEHRGLHWRCAECGKAYNRDHLSPYPQCWFRADVMDAQWRDRLGMDA